MWKLPGTLNGVEGFFRCITDVNNSCGTGGSGNRHGDSGPYTNLTGNWIFVPASITVRSNPDYLVFGTWIIEPDPGTSGNYETGSYATGTNPFDYRKVEAVEGIAEYRGAVVGTGVYDGLIDGETVSYSNRMTGSVDLIADFQDRNESGTISADFKGSAPALENLRGMEFEVKFDSVDLSPAQDFYFGSNVAASDSKMYRGEDQFSSPSAEWSGKFYGVSDNGKKPNGVSGLFSSTQTKTGNTLSFNGAFGAYCYLGCYKGRR